MMCNDNENIIATIYRYDGIMFQCIALSTTELFKYYIRRIIL